MNNSATVPFDDYLELEKKCDELAERLAEANMEIETLKEELKNEIEYRQDNFRMIPEMELYGLKESDFH